LVSRNGNTLSRFTELCRTVAAELGTRSSLEL
jgi:hypothetical protein